MKRLQLFPATTTIEDDALAIGGFLLRRLVEVYGTPLYIYDRTTLDRQVTGYQSILASTYPGRASITYAGKAFLCKAIAQWTQVHNLTVDCSSAGEIAIALAGGVPRSNILVHGVNKSRADLISTLKHAGTIVVDHLSELELLHNQAGGAGCPSVWLRLLPGQAVQTHHAHTQTGQYDSKFGMTSVECLEAADFCRRQGISLIGIHFHLGSNFHDTTQLRQAIKTGVELVKQLGFQGDWNFSPGGGWGVAYHEDQLPQPDVSEYIQAISSEVVESCHRHGLSLPHLHLEPGRSLIALAGVSVYQVGAVKQRPGRKWILVDGGMTDNPRPALYGARYTCLPVSHPDREVEGIVSIGGPHCESGDILIEDLPMPRLEAGDLIAIPVSGAY